MITSAAIWLSNLNPWPPQPVHELTTRFGLSINDAEEAVSQARWMKILRRAFG